MTLYTGLASDFHVDIRSVGILLERRQARSDPLPHILMLLRPAHKEYPDRWGLPGGKIEGKETVYETAQRELAQETGIERETRDFRYAGTFRLCHRRNIEYTVVRTQLLAGTPFPRVVLNEEHLGYRWMTPQEVFTSQEPVMEDQDKIIWSVYRDVLNP